MVEILATYSAESGQNHPQIPPTRHFVRDREIASCDTRNLVTARPARFLEHVVKRFPARPVAPGPLTRSP
jgi:hypothetical protein